MSYIKNTKVITYDLTYKNITFCYGRKAYRETIKAYTGISEDMSKDGISVRLTKSDGSLQYLVAVIKPGKLHNITSIKALAVHELSHLTSMIMEDTGIQDDEFRSHMIQYLYEMYIPFIDNIYYKKVNT